jgi:hypothetical protein
MFSHQITMNCLPFYFRYQNHTRSFTQTRQVSV